MHLTVPASGLPRTISCGHRSLPRAQVTIICLATSHKSSTIALLLQQDTFFQCILQCLAIHSMSAAGNNKCDLHTYTDIIIAGRSMLILGKNSQFYSPKKYREASAQSSAFHSNWNEISITPLGFATPVLIDGININTPIWNNLTKPTRLGITAGLLHTAEQTGPTLSGRLLQLGLSVGSNTRGCMTMEPRTGPFLTTVSLSQLSDVGQYESLSLSPPPALLLAVDEDDSSEINEHTVYMHDAHHYIAMPMAFVAVMHLPVCFICCIVVQHLNILRFRV